MKAPEDFRSIDLQEIVMLAQKSTYSEWHQRKKRGCYCASLPGG